MSQIRMSGLGDINNIASVLTKEIEGSGLSCELIGSAASSNSMMLVFEKYYMRASNRASLSIMLSMENEIVYADIVGSGGGQGALIRFSWGAEDDFVGMAQSVLNGLGFN